MTLQLSGPIRPVLAAARELPLRAAAVIALALIAYNYSLLTLARGLTLQTPLAYLALVPVLAIGLAAVRIRLERRGVPIHDRQVDWIIGGALLVGTAIVLIVLPNSTSSGFWLQRVDLLTLPLFVSGLIALVFGVRRVWSLKFPIAFLFLAWPVPYTLFLSGATSQFTEGTTHLVAAFTRVVPIAVPAAGDDTLFFIGSGADRFGVSIGSACAGLNGFVGFLLLGTALLYLVRGGLVRRIAWLIAGLLFIFVLNVVRIVAILGAGAAFGQAAALDVLHPVAGLIVFSVGVLGMILLVPLFGLRFIDQSDVLARSVDRVPAPVRRARRALLVATVLTVVLAVTNATYARFESISSGLADARLQTFDARTAIIPNWETRPMASFAIAKQYFGASATWDRVLWWPGAAASLYSSRSVYVDVVTTDDPGTFASYNLEACYRFHGYRIASVATTDIGAGVQAQVIDYVHEKGNVSWSALWWEWPYQENGRTRYERIVILISDGPDTTYRGIVSEPVPGQAPAFATSDRFLVTLGRQVVRSQLREPAAS